MHGRSFAFGGSMSRFLGLVVLSVSSIFAFSAGAQTATTTTVNASPTSGLYGGSVALAAGVAASTAPVVNGSGGVILPTGTVQFLDGATALSTTPVALAAGPPLTSTPFASVFGKVDPSFAGAFNTAVGDLNGDGTQDLLIYAELESDMSGGGANGTVKVQSFDSNGKGGFTTNALQSLALPAGALSTPQTPVLLDLNGDGKLDLLIGTAVAYGNGDGTFLQPVTLSFLASGFTSTYAADVTGDGKTDLVALDTVTGNCDGYGCPASLQATVFANLGGGKFQPLGTFTLSSSSACGCAFTMLASLSFVDLNDDGKLDMVAQSYFVPFGNSEEPATITTLLNNGDGTFAAPVQVTYTSQQDGGAIELLSLQAADFNRDGKIDLALIYSSQSENGNVNFEQTPIIFVPGNGDGTFGAETDSTITIPAPASSSSGVQPPEGNAISTDVNLDGAVDLAFGNGAVVLGNGKGSFSADTAIASSVPESTVNLIQLAELPFPALVYGTLPTVGTAPVPPVLTLDITSTASLAVTTLAPGTHSITASYSADTHYAASTSAPVSVTIAPAFTVQGGGGSTDITVTSGQSASAQLSVTGGAGYTGSLALTCTGLPVDASCTFNPGMLSLSGGATVTSTLTVSTAASTTSMLTPLFGVKVLSCGMFASGLLFLWPRRRRASWLAIALVACALLPMGCGANKTPANNTPVGTYTFKVVATAGGLQTTTGYTLTVQ
jgi:hypothetical protein